MRRTRSSLVTAALAAALSAPLLLTASPVSAAGPYEKGPAPTQAALDASRGPFATASVSVSDFSTSGFGSATITYPTTSGTYGGVAVSPGYTASESTIAWLGPRVASHGFVVITFNTQSRYDQPSARGDQLLAALDYLTRSSSVRTRVDASRLAVMGHSMGGGGTLEAAKDRPSLKATIGLTPYNLDKTWPEVVSPSLIIGAEDDSVAPVDSHSIPFYGSLSRVPEKAYVELGGASHFAPNSPNEVIGRYSVAWLKRFVDDDLRYSQFLCPGPSVSSFGAVSDYRATCAI